MNDEGIGIAGWLLADLTLVLALIFLALVPGRAAEPETPMPTPTPTVTASPTPTPTPEALPDPGLPQADFGFDQLVLSGIGSDHTADALAPAIAGAGVRPGLSKSDEDAKSPGTEGTAGEWLWEGTAREWLRQKQEECWRIALVETFSRPLDAESDGRVQASLDLSKKVNEALFAWLGESEDGPPPNGGIFYGGADAVQEEKTAAYFSSFGDRTADRREARINLFFVKDQACDPSP